VVEVTLRKMRRDGVPLPIPRRAMRRCRQAKAGNKREPAWRPGCNPLTE